MAILWPMAWKPGSAPPPGESNPGLSNLLTGSLETSFRHPQNPNPPTDLSASYEWSPNLVDWYGSAEGPEGGPTVSFSASTTDGTATVTATASETMERIFMRLEVTGN